MLSGEMNPAMRLLQDVQIAGDVARAGPGIAAAGKGIVAPGFDRPAFGELPDAGMDALELGESVGQDLRLRAVPQP